MHRAFQLWMRDDRAGLTVDVARPNVDSVDRAAFAALDLLAPTGGCELDG